jgi:hypothetical protein
MVRAESGTGPRDDADVKATQRDEVVQIRGTAIVPMPDVMPIGACRGNGASRKAAALIATLHRQSEARCDQAIHAPDVNREPIALHHRDDVSVATRSNLPSNDVAQHR